MIFWHLNQWIFLRTLLDFLTTLYSYFYSWIKTYYNRNYISIHIYYESSSFTTLNEQYFLEILFLQKYSNLSIFSLNVYFLPSMSHFSIIFFDFWRYLFRRSSILPFKHLFFNFGSFLWSKVYDLIYCFDGLV